MLTFCICLSVKLSRIRSRYRLNASILINNLFRINRNIGNVRARPRDNDGNNICVMTYSSTIIAPRDLENPFGPITLTQFCPENPIPGIISAQLQKTFTFISIAWLGILNILKGEGVQRGGGGRQKRSDRATGCFLCVLC